jgi:peptide/nickel transport system substrate-binding protein
LPEDIGFVEYNVEGANALLDEAGWVDTNDNGIRDKDGVELVLRFFTTTRQIRMDYQVFIQEYLADVGIEAQLLPIPSGVLFASFLERGVLDTGDWDLALFALSTGPLSPFANAPELFGCDGVPTPEDPNGKNGWGFCSEEFDSLDLQVGTTVDPQERLELAHQAQRAFFEGQFWHGLYLRPTWYAFDGSVIDTSTVQDLGTLSSNYFNKVELWQPVQ